MSEQLIEELRLLADDLNIRDPAKLLRAARKREVRDATLQFAKQALSTDVGRQVLRPPPRSLGKSAAENPDTRLQADLIDFSSNARSKHGVKYALLLSEVFTREAEVRSLKTKNPEEVTEQLNQALAELVGEKKGYVLTTDEGKEFSQVENVLEGDDAVHKEKGGGE